MTPDLDSMRYTLWPPVLVSRWPESPLGPPRPTVGFWLVKLFLIGALCSSALPGLRAADGENPPAAVIRRNARFEILSPTLVRMEYAPEGRFVDTSSVSVPIRNWPGCPIDVHEANGWVDIATSRMQVKYKLGSGKFAPENLTVSWTDMGGTHLWKPGDVDDKNLGGVPGEDPNSLRPPNEQPGPLSRNGYFWLDDSDTAVWNAARQWPEPRTNRKEAQDWYFFTYGLDYKGLLRELSELLGPIPMVPRYVFGTWYGDRAAYSSTEWQRIVHRFREEEIPLDVVMLDSDSSAVKIWSGFSWDPELLPDPKAFFAWMRSQGVKVGIVEHFRPITAESDTHFGQVREAMGLPEGTREIELDLANRKLARLYMDVLHKPALDMGMTFWWQDGFAQSKMDGLEPMLWTRHIEYEGEERITGKRAFVLCRLNMPDHTWDLLRPRPPAWVKPAWGVHRYGLYFTGDMLPRWSQFETLVPFNVRSGNTLVPYVSHTIPGCLEETLDHELYQRSVQFAAFSPVFWWHGLWGLRQPWEYGEEGHATAKQFLTLRYRLLPYIYTYARLAHETGAPLVRGTYLEYPQQEGAYTFTHQYLFGQELLVAPITQPGGGHPARKEIYLPAGEYWYDYFTGRIYPGGQVVSYECPMNRMPLFVKAGSILPMASRMDYTDQRPLDPLVLDVYAGKRATFRLYEDDGASLDYRKKAFAWTPISYEPAAAQGRHLITIGPTEGQHQGQLKARRYRMQIHGLLRPAAVLMHDRALPENQPDEGGTDGWTWHPAEQVAEINLTQPIDIRTATTVTLEQSGRFQDALAVQAVRAYRERVRRVQVVEKLRWAMLLEPGGLADSGNEPRVVQVTEEVEQALNDLVDNPAGLGEHLPAFKGMTAAILDAFAHRPFAPTRKQPSKDSRFTAGQEQVAQGSFTPDELHRMTAELLGCELESSVAGNAMIFGTTVEGPVLRARVKYDTTCIGPPQLHYELSFPDDGPPGWAEVERSAGRHFNEVAWQKSRYFNPSDEDESATFFKIRAPFPPRPGSHPLKLKVTMTWGPTQAVLEREVDWVVGSDPVDPATWSQSD